MTNHDPSNVAAADQSQADPPAEPLPVLPVLEYSHSTEWVLDPVTMNKLAVRQRLLYASAMLQVLAFMTMLAVGMFGTGDGRSDDFFLAGLFAFLFSFVLIPIFMIMMLVTWNKPERAIILGLLGAVPILGLLIAIHKGSEAAGLLRSAGYRGPVLGAYHPKQVP